MSVVINTNIMSLQSQRYLGNSNNALGKSIERLSSGLRINHAADDASGMAISEKLRGQISGLKRASMNAQDGISMLQTAEAALGEVSSMLQRMRELAVQAANGTYTSSDRVELQKEVEQLKSEINRIGTATEFNTKKLLNGDGTALWSSTGTEIEAIIKSDVDEGNYKVTVNTDPGQNQVFKTDIMTLQEGTTAAEITTNGVLARSIDDVSGLNSTVHVTGNYTMTLSKTDITADSTIAISSFQADASSDIGNLATATATAGNTITKSGYVEVEFTSSFTDTTAASTLSSVARVRFYDAADGSLSGWTNADWDNVNSSLSISSLDGTETLLLGGTNGDSYFEGDKSLVYVVDSSLVDSSVATNTQVSINDSYGNTSVQEVAGLVSGTTYNTSTIYLAEIDNSNGNVNYGNFTLEMGQAADVVAGALSFDVSTGGDRATIDTKLKDITRFVDGDGNNIFENKQELTVWGNGTSAVIYLEGDDTISDLEEKMTTVLVEKLGMGSDDVNVNSHLVDYINSAETNGLRTVEGTFIIQTALTGEQGEIAFSGSQALIDAFSLAEVQESVNNTTTVTVVDAHTGASVGTDQTGNDRAEGIIEGIEIVIDSRAGISSSWGVNNEVTFTSAGNRDFFLHIVDNSTDLQIGANQGQSLSVSIPQLDSTGLGIEKLWLVSQDLAQQAIPDIDSALTKVVSIRATIGAQINRLEHTISTLDVARENMTASESRIRDLDMADEMAEFTKYQILAQAGTAMLSQANQIPQMALQLLQ